MDIIEDAQRIMRSYGDIPIDDLLRKVLSEEKSMTFEPGHLLERLREKWHAPDLEPIGEWTTRTGDMGVYRWGKSYSLVVASWTGKMLILTYASQESALEAAQVIADFTDNGEEQGL